ncbi:MAG TPA: branched-chain amino acid ABC transporter permease [Herbaspirillum sp.]|nr:branched-chain amino acid ABC transporter permease [Herbaspirillum sp.]
MLQLIINGLAMGAIYALIALGLLQIFNAVRIVNFAQGQLLMLGAFLGFTTMTQMALPIWLSYLITFAAMAIIGVIFMLVAYYPLRGKPFYLVILTTIAVGIVLENLVLIFFGPLPQSVPSPFGEAQVQLGSVVISRHVLFIFVATAVLLIGQWWFMNRTRFGRMIRATALDMDMARLVGIPVRATIAVAFMLGSVLAGAAGLLVAPLFLADPTMGGALGLKAFVVAVIGGFGSLYGAVLAGLLLGVVETLAAGYISSDFRDVISFVIMIGFLFVRPQGLFGEKQSERV